MASKSQVLCKYHMSGACRFGAACAFSHNLHDLPNLVCKYYLAGCCSYGDRCRYDHKRPERLRGQQQQQQQQQASGAETRTAAQGGRCLLAAAGPNSGASRAASSSTGGGNAAAASPGAPSTSGRAPPAAPPAASQPARWAAGAVGSSSAAASWGAPGARGGQGAPEEQGDDDGADYGHYGQGGYGYYQHGYDGEYYDDGADESEEAEASEPAAGAAPVASTPAAEGLTMVDDDVGLEQELATARDHAGSAARTAAASPPPALHERDPVKLADLELCPEWSLSGRCAEAGSCPFVHGIMCEVCLKPRIHPYNADAAAEHLASCQLRHDRLEARLRSADVECGICLEAVLSKASVAEQRFGLLACDHAFCLPCIRAWRERNTDETLATDTAVRTCPICRTPTHFVTPSLVWPATPEDKEAIVTAYKLKLSTIDCRNFDFGDGTCAFGTSCFYRHMYRDGRMEEVVLRRAGNADGDVRVVVPVRLSAYFETPQAQRLLNRRR